VFVSSIRLSDLETGFLVGFLEAEAHFAITPANCGQSMCCSAALVC